MKYLQSVLSDAVFVYIIFMHVLFNDFCVCFSESIKLPSLIGGHFSTWAVKPFTTHVLFL